MSKNLDGINADAERAPLSPRAQAVANAHASLGSLFDLVMEADIKLALVERDALERGESVTLLGVDFAHPAPEGDASVTTLVVDGTPIAVTPITFLDEGRLEFDFPEPVALPTPALTALCESMNSLLELAETTDIDQLSRGLVDLEATRQTPLPRRFAI